MRNVTLKSHVNFRLRYLWKTTMIAFAVVVSSLIGCGQNKNVALSPTGGGYYPNYPGNNYGHGTYIDEAIGYNTSLGHQISLTFFSLQNYGTGYGYQNGYHGYQQGYGSYYQGYGGHANRNGPVNIGGFVTFGGSINDYGGYNAGYHNQGYHQGYNQGYYQNYNYDPCYIPVGQPLQLGLDPQYGQAAIRQGNDFGEYELLAYGMQGEIIAISPVNPTVGASFIAGHNLSYGQPYVHMEVVVQRIDSGMHCSEHYIVFGAGF